MLLIGSVLKTKATRSTTARTASDTNAGTAFSGLIEASLVEERSRKFSLESRGVGLITSSGAFVSLVLAVVALATRPQDTDLPAPAVAFLLLAVILFLAAAIAGVVCNRPRDYDEPTPNSLLRMIEAHWDADREMGARMVAKSRVAVYGCAQVRNGEKADALSWGTRAQVCGMVALSLAVLCVLLV